MAKIHPFRACRFDPKQHHELDALVAPPYDVISPEQRKKLAAYSPHNIVHVTLSEDGVDSTGQSPFYAEAAQRLEEWLSEGAARVDSEPAYYLLHHRFLSPDGEEGSRYGFFALTDLRPFEEGVVRPHEKTYPGAVADRLALMRACESSLSPVWFLYRDQGDMAMKLMAEAVAGREPDQRFKMADGQSGELFAVTDGALQAEVARRIAAASIIIADGHHRYTTTLAYHEETLAAGGRPRIFGYFTCLDSPDILLLATHRGLCGLPDYDPEKLERSLAEDFEILDLKDETLPSAAFSQLNFVWCRPDGSDALLVLNEAGEARLRELVPEAILAGLDVTAFRELILKKALVLDEMEMKKGGQLRFYPSEALGRMALERGDLQGLFLMSALPPAKLGEITDAGQVTPQKTTYFFPKVPSGLLWHRFAED